MDYKPESTRETMLRLEEHQRRLMMEIVEVDGKKMTRHEAECIERSEYSARLQQEGKHPDRQIQQDYDDNLKWFIKELKRLGLKHCGQGTLIGLDWENKSQ